MYEMTSSEMHSPTLYNLNTNVPFTPAAEDFAMYAQSLPIYNQHGELTHPYASPDYDCSNNAVPILSWSSSSEPEIKKQQHYYQQQQRSQYTPQCPPRIKEEDYQLYQQTAFVKHPYYNFTERTYPHSTDPSLSPLSAYADFESHHFAQQQQQQQQQQPQHHWHPSPPTTSSSLSPQSHRRSSLASSIDSIHSDINPPIADVDMNMAAMHSIARSSLVNGINNMGSIGLNNHPRPHHQMSMSPLDMSAQAHISVVGISPNVTYPHQHLQTIDMGQHNIDHSSMSTMNGHSHGVGVGINPAGVNPVGVHGHDIDSRMGMDGSNQIMAGTVGIGSMGSVDDMSEEDAEGEDDWEQLQQQDPTQDYQQVPAGEVYQNGWSEEVEGGQINTREVAAVAVHQQQQRQRQLSREARKIPSKSARRSHSASNLSARVQQHRLYTHLVKPDPADEDDQMSRSSLEEEEDFDDSSEDDIDDDDDDDEFIPGHQQASQRRRRFRSTTASSRRGASGSNSLGYSANDSAPSLHHFSQNGGGGGYANSEGRRTSRSVGGIKYNTYSSYIEQANASGFYDDGTINGDDQYSSGSGSPAPDDGGRSLSRGSARSTVTSTPSLSSSTNNKQRRSRPLSTVPIPVPVPNLTKKSRGRRVPTMSSLEDLRSASSGAGKKKQSAAAGKNARMYLCDIEGCGKCFARGEHLKRHVRSIHTYDKPHKCPYPGCGKRFSRHDNLGQHMRVHKDYVPPPGSISSAGSSM